MNIDQLSDARSASQFASERKTVILHNLARCARMMLFAAALLYLAGYFGDAHWIADLSANFVPHITAVTIVCVLIFVSARWFRCGVIAALLLVAELVTLAPYMENGELRADAPGDDFKLRILQFNVNSQNTDWRSFADWIRPRVDTYDVIVLLENTPSWIPLVNELIEGFPTHLQVVSTDSYGIAVFSRLPGSKLNLRQLGSNRLPTVELQAKLGGKPFTAVAAHTYTPLGRKSSEARNEQLQELTKWMGGEKPGYRVLLGDLNVTPFSPWFRYILKTTNLVDAQFGLGMLPTWAPGVIPTFLGLPIDHTLISGDLTVAFRGCSERFGSDHCPVTTELRGNSE